jgi:hypothetical protein
MYNHTATNPFSIAFDVLTAPGAHDWYYQQVEAGAARHIGAITAAPIVLGYGVYQAALAAYNLALFVYAAYQEQPAVLVPVTVEAPSHPLYLPPARYIAPQPRQDRVKSWLQQQLASGQPIQGDVEKTPAEVLAVIDNKSDFRFGQLAEQAEKPKRTRKPKTTTPQSGRQRKSVAS